MGCPSGAMCFAQFFIRRACILLGADEVGNALNRFAVAAKQFKCIGFQTIGDRGNRIRFIDRIRNDRLECRVLAQQRDVCTMQCGHDWEIQSFGSQNAPEP